MAAIERLMRAHASLGFGLLRDPDLATLHGDPDFERLYPAPKKES